MFMKKNKKEKGIGIIDRGMAALHIKHVARIGIFIGILILLAAGIGVVSATTHTIQPGESIQEAINNLPPEGGIIELAAGTHEITEEMYPTGAFTEPAGDIAYYSIIITKSNVIIQGTHDSIVRHHTYGYGGDYNKPVRCFYIPDLKLIEEPDVFVENVTFNGFTTASIYTQPTKMGNDIIAARHVRNLTVKDMHGTSHARRLVSVTSSQNSEHQRHSYDIYIKNNTMEHCAFTTMFCYNIWILNNTIKDNPGIWSLHTDRNCYNMHIIGNYVTHNRPHACCVIDSGADYEVRDNIFEGSTSYGMVLNNNIQNAIIENNTIKVGNTYGIYIWARGLFDNITISNNRIYDLNGIGIYGGVMSSPYDPKNIIVRNNVIYNCGEDGIRLDNELYSLTVTNSIITNNTGYGINCISGTISHSYNYFYGNTQGNFYGTTAGTGDREAVVDPKFASIISGAEDFHLKSTALNGRWTETGWMADSEHSPCIDAGDPSSDYSNERDYPLGHINMGAYGNTEYASLGSAVGDITPPYTSNHNPTKDATNVPGDTNIVVHIKDDGEGVDQSSIVMTVEGATVTPTITGTAQDYTLTYTPATPFDYSQVVGITLNAQDLASPPNIMPPDSYSFTIEAGECYTYKLVNPDESIQDAIDGLCSSGGTIELATGTHEITEAMYPTKSYTTGATTFYYSIGVNKSNVIITGTHSAIVKSHLDNGACFQVLSNGYSNIIFKDFSTDSSYTSGAGSSAIFRAENVTGFTVENINDSSHARNLAAASTDQGSPLYSRNIFFRSNKGLHTSLVAIFSTNVHIENNTLEGGVYAINVNRNLEDVYVIGNHVAGAIHALHIHGAVTNLLVQNNTFAGRNPLIQDTAGDISNGIIENNVFRNGRDYGISLSASSSLQNYTIRNNRIYDNGGPGVDVRFWRNEIARETNIVNNVIYNNDGDGIRLDDHTWTLNVTNNIITNNTGYGINHISGSILHSYNDVWGNTLGSYSDGTTAGEGEIEVDPKFADPTNHDFHPRSTSGRWTESGWVYTDTENSACIDAGDPFSDCSNEPEPNGGRINMGAYGNTAEASKSASTAPDTTPPYTQDHNPLPDATEVSRDTNIIVHIKDDGDGVDQSSIIMTVEGTTVTPTITGTAQDYTLTYTPAAPFDYEQVVDVTIDAQDLASPANVMPQDSYSFSIEGESNIYYVSTNGNDSNSGTEDNPWRTIQKAADTLVAGDIVYVKDGSYAGVTGFANSGTEDNLIAFRAYPGDNVKIELGENNLLINKNYIRVEGFEITGGGMIYLSYATGSELISNYIHNASSIGVYVAHGGNNTIKGNDIAFNEGSGMYVGYESNYNKILENKFRNNGGNGLNIKASANYNLIEKNEIYENGIGDGEDGINVYGSPGEGYPTTEHNVFQFNVIHDHMADLPAHSDGFQGYNGANNNTFYSNLVYRTRHQPFHFGSDCYNNTIEGNIIYQPEEQPYLEHHSLAYPSNGGVLIHNTFYGSTVRLFGGDYTVTIRDNIIERTSSHYPIYGGDYSAGFTADYDLLYSPAGVYYSDATGKSYTTVAQWFAAEGQEEHGKDVDPLFVNSDNMDLRLQPTSPAKGSASDGKDMGAFFPNMFIPTLVKVSDMQGTSVTITWETTKSADSTVKYGGTTSYGLSKQDPTLTTSHSIMLTNLAQGEYHCRVKSKDATGYETISSDYIFFVFTGEPSPTGTISGTVTDGTNPIQAATVTVGTTGLSCQTGSGGTYTIANVPVGKGYNATCTAPPIYQDATQSNVVVNEGEVTTVDFALTKETTPPTITAHSPTGTDAAIDTDMSATFSEVMNKTSAEAAFSTDLLVLGSFSWDGNKMIFNPNSNLDYLTTYIVTISTEAEDLAGNNLLSPYSWQFTTKEQDLTPPVISNVTASTVTGSSAVITWTTDEPSTSQIEYGLTSSYGSSTTLDANLVIEHSQPITGLNPNTTYHFRVKSKDADNNEAVSGDYNFTTSEETNLVADWKFNEGTGSTAADSSGNGNDGTLVNNPTRVNGKIGNALSFDGVNDYISTTNSPSLNPADEITIIAWVKPSVTPQTGWNKIIAKPFTSRTSPWQQYALTLYDAHFVFELNAGGSKSGVHSTAPLVNNTWYHVAGTYNGSEMRIYVNAVLNGTLLKSGVIAEYSTNVHIGAGIYSDAQEEYINGTIDEVKIYNRALDADEIMADYEKGLEDKTPPASISNLQNFTGTTWINWTWTNPEDADFNHTTVHINGTFVENRSESTPFYNATYTAHATRTISTHTVDNSGNTNSTWVNQTTTIPNNVPVLESIGDKTIDEGQKLKIDANATDLDLDSLTYSCNRTADLFTDFKKTTGEGNWTSSSGDAGTYYVDFGVYDGYGGIANETVKITVNDVTPPASITNLANVTENLWINWTWTKPEDDDFNHTMVYLNGDFKTNTSSTYYNATGLSPDTNYEVRTHTVDTNGNVNATWMNQTAKTLAVSTPSPCFIATAAYGTPLHEDIDVLRAFRDEYLMTNSLGRTFVEIYYAASPPIADVIRENEGLRTAVREGLVKPLVYVTRLLVG